MSHLSIWTHFVWATKNRYPFLSQAIRPLVLQHIRENATAKNIQLDTIGGYTDHIHALIELDSGYSASKIMQLIKGESSRWINQQHLTKQKFQWQSEFYGISVAESQLGYVRNYINNQEEHHRQKTFQEEYEELMKEIRNEDGEGVG